MNLLEIENLSAAEIKKRRAELVEAAKHAKNADPGDVAERYVQARLDAKLRDERLAEQGKTIAALQAGVDSLTQQLAAEQQAHAATAERLRAIEEGSARRMGEHEEFRQRANAQLTELERMRVEQLNHAIAATELAKARRQALAAVMQTIAPLLAEENN